MSSRCNHDFRTWAPSSPSLQKRVQIDTPASKLSMETISESSSTTFTFSSAGESDRAFIPYITPDDINPPAQFSTNIQPSVGNPLPQSASSSDVEAEAWKINKRVSSQVQQDTQTSVAYGRILASYDTFWVNRGLQHDTENENPKRTVTAARPITAAKATVFLNHEKNRPKRKRGSDEPIAGTNLGKSALSQIVSALEWTRRNDQHEYPNDPETRIPLRSDIRITNIEKAAKHNEPNRIARSQILKAAGTSSDTYTTPQLVQLSIWCLEQLKGPASFLMYLRDRAMLNTSGTMAFRGDSARALLWSDMFISMVPMQALGVGQMVPVLAFLADNAKHNQHGRVDEHGTLRHRMAELCPVGAIAFMFFAYFHVANSAIPLSDFVPDFSDVNYGEYGRREWYKNRLFIGSDLKENMCYETHWARVKHMHQSNNISISKATHAGRGYAASNARAHGASVSGTKALGGWSEGGAFRACYDRAFPVDALLGASMYDGARQEKYFMARGTLEVSTELTGQIFPWIEAARHALDEREQADIRAKDIALRQFLAVMEWFRTVLIQDAAVLFNRVPTSKLWNYPPFNTATFRQFAARSIGAIQVAEENARLAFENLPEHIVGTLRGAYTNVSLSQQQYQQANEARLDNITNQVLDVRGLLMTMMGSKRRKTTAAPYPDSFSTTPLFHSAPLLSNAVPSLPTPPPFQANITVNIPAHSNMSFSSSTPSSPTTVPVSFNAAPVAGPLPQLPPVSLSPIAQTTANLTEAEYLLAAQVHADKAAKWAVLVQKFGAERVNNHQWEWVNNGHLPFYAYNQNSTTILSVWEEWSVGVGGHLSLRELEENWGATWRRNDGGARQEAYRRKKIIDVINELAAKPGWNIKLTLRFLSDTYSMHSARQFFEKVIRKNRSSIFAAAAAYVH